MQGTGIRCFQIHGTLYHLQGPLQHHHNSVPVFAQLYFYNPAYTAQARHIAHPILDYNVLQNLTIILHEVNHYIAIYKTAKQWLDAISLSQSEARVVLNPQLFWLLKLVQTDEERIYQTVKRL